MKGTIEKLIETQGGGEARVKTESGVEVVSVGKFYLCLPEWGQDEFEDRLKDYHREEFSHPPIIVGDEVKFEKIDDTLTVTEIVYKPHDPRKKA